MTLTFATLPTVKTPLQSLVNLLIKYRDRVFENQLARIVTYVLSPLVILGLIGSYVSPNSSEEPTPLGAVIFGSLVLLGVLVGAIQVEMRTQKNAKPKRKLSDEEKMLMTEVKSAQKNLKVATKTNHKLLKSSRQQLAYLNDPKGKRLASGGGVAVFERWIVTPQGSGSIIGVTATAGDNTSISKRLTVTRMVGLGIFSLAAPKKKGVGNAYVVVEGPNVNGVATFAAKSNQDAGPAAFRLAAAINNAARNSVNIEQNRPDQIRQVQLTISQIEAAPEVHQAQSRLDEALAKLPDDLRQTVCTQ